MMMTMTAQKLSSACLTTLWREIGYLQKWRYFLLEACFQKPLFCLFFTTRTWTGVRIFVPVHSPPHLPLRTNAPPHSWHITKVTLASLAHLMGWVNLSYGQMSGAGGGECPTFTWTIASDVKLVRPSITVEGHTECPPLFTSRSSRQTAACLSPIVWFIDLHDFIQTTFSQFHAQYASIRHPEIAKLSSGKLHKIKWLYH